MKKLPFITGFLIISAINSIFGFIVEQTQLFSFRFGFGDATFITGANYGFLNFLLYISEAVSIATLWKQKKEYAIGMLLGLIVFIAVIVFLFLPFIPLLRYYISVS